MQTGAATSTTQVPFRSPAGVGVVGRASAPVMEGFTQVETLIINEARTILSSEGMTTIRSAQQAGQAVEVQIGGRIIIYEPGLPASGMTAFGDNGFLIGPQAFTSEVELGQTILHELYRLSTSQSAAGVSQILVTQETVNAFNFASRAIQHAIVP